MSIILYGIPNCDTVKKARTWLAEKGVSYEFHDYKKAGVDPARVARWIELAGLDKVLNKAGTTFKKLPDEVKAGVSESNAPALMVEHPSTIKRPIVEHPGGILVGFKPDEWSVIF